MKYTVIRQHLGDRMYMPGEEREASPSEVRHLVKNDVLAEAKVERRPANKVEPAVQNKSDPLDHDQNGRRGGAKKPA